MTTEKVSIEQAVQRLSDASINQTITEKLTTDLSTLESNMVEGIQTIQLQTQDWQTNTMTKLEEGQQQWNSLTDAVRDMKNEI
jgi:sensor domain CHASE-containing protein